MNSAHTVIDYLVFPIISNRLYSLQLLEPLPSGVYNMLEKFFSLYETHALAREFIIIQLNQFLEVGSIDPKTGMIVECFSIQDIKQQLCYCETKCENCNPSNKQRLNFRWTAFQCQFQSIYELEWIQKETFENSTWYSSDSKKFITWKSNCNPLFKKDVGFHICKNGEMCFIQS